MPIVLSVSLSPTHTFSKPVATEIEIQAGHGILGDAHAGALVRHRYLVRKNPNAPNFAQVHLLHSELFPELAAKGIMLTPGQLGENITTTGLDLLNLPLDTLLHLGSQAVVRITGLRQPCVLMNALHPGLMQACLVRIPGKKLQRKAGVMAIALSSGTVHPGDPIHIELPATPHTALGPV